jgi:hypothetical protein
VTLRKLVGVVPVVAALALAAPVASASAQTTPVSGPGSMIPCYPYPAFCGPNGQPWFTFPFPLPPFPGLFGSGLVPVPTPPFRLQGTS